MRELARTASMAAAVLLAAGLVSPASSVAQSYEISWSTVDGGGTSLVTGGAYSLGGTVGQPDAAAALTGGGYSLTGGFWTGATVTPIADLSITKSDAQVLATPGAAITYAIAVSSAGPSAVPAVVTDTLPPAIHDVTWTCTGTGCRYASGSGDLNETVDLSPAGPVTFSVTGTVDAAARGTLVNTASVNAPAGSFDPNPANNQAMDSDNLAGSSADLRVTKTDGLDFVAAGQPVVYRIGVENAGPHPLLGVSVADAVPANLLAPTWTCVASAGASCAASGGGSIADTVVLPAGGSLAYTLSGTVGSGATTLTNTASVTVPSGLTDPLPDNNSATDSEPVLVDDEATLVADGRIVPLVVPAAGDRWFVLSTVPDRTYVVEALHGAPAAGTLAVEGASTRDVSAVDPASHGAARLSFQASGRVHRLRVGNPGGAPVSYEIALSETSAYSPAWSTNGAYNTYYSVRNTTRAPITVTLTLHSVGGVEQGSVTTAVPAQAVASFNTAALGVARNQTGTTRLTHDGPVGALILEAAIASFATTPAYIQPVKFDAPRAVR